LQAFAKEHGLSQMANFHFLTGMPDQLQAVWKAYGIYVQATGNGDVQHSSLVYLLDRQGQERYLIAANITDASTDDWGAGLAYYAKSLLSGKSL
ncbi:MAG: SCO family protein, partial [Alicyclobacillus sp.]|nr:SCO family protein [Alicyclobacillus sp.]